MRYVADPQSDHHLDARFSSRLPPWTAQSRHWLTLVMQLKTSGATIGVHGMQIQQSGMADLGYLLLPQWQGKGYASEATAAVIAFAFEHCGLHTLQAWVTAGNVASEQLLRRHGFVLAARLAGAVPLHGEVYDDQKFILEVTEFIKHSQKFQD